MSLRFRKSFKLFPGVKLNLSKSGLSASFGGSPFTLNIGSRGIFATTSIPGTGLSMRQRLSGRPVPLARRKVSSSSGYSNLEHFPRPPIQFSPAHYNPAVASVGEVPGARPDLLTSDCFKELSAMLKSTSEQRDALSRERASASAEETKAAERFHSWNNGFWLKRICRGAFSVRRAKAEITAAKVTGLEEQLRHSASIG
jgi:hypothetical protein